MRRVVATARARRLRASRRRAAASPSRSCRRSTSSKRGCSSPTRSAASSARSRGAYRAELDARPLGSRPAAPRRGRAAPLRPRRLARRAGLRVRLRGSDGRGVGAARGARRAHRRHRFASRTSPGAPAFALAPADGRRSRAARRRRRSRSCRRATGRDRAAGARAPRARALRGRAGRSAPPLDGAIRFFEGAGGRGTLELVGEELLALVRAGMPPEQIGHRRARDRPRPRRRSTRCSAVRHPVRRRRRAADHADAARPGARRAAPLRVGGRDAQRPLHVSPLAVLRARAPLGRLRRGAPARPGRAERPSASSRSRRGCAAPRSRRSTSCARPRSRSRPCGSWRTRMLRNAYGIERPPADDASRLDLRAYDALVRLLAELDGWRELAGTLSREDVLAAVERLTLRPQRGRRGRPRRGRRSPPRAHAALRGDVRARAGGGEPAAARRRLAVPRRRRAARARRARRTARAARPGLARPLPLLHGVHARVAAALSRARGGRRRRQPARGEPVLARRPRRSSTPRTCERGRRGARSRRSPRRSTRRRPTASACAGSPSSPRATPARRARIARANGWDRRLERARSAFKRPTRITNPLILEQLGSRSSFGVTELERFADCSSAWFVERFLAPKTIDAEPDAMQRGSVAHTALHRFFTRVPGGARGREARAGATSTTRSA